MAAIGRLQALFSKRIREVRVLRFWRNMGVSMDSQGRRASSLRKRSRL